MIINSACFGGCVRSMTNNQRKELSGYGTVGQTSVFGWKFVPYQAPVCEHGLDGGERG